MPRRSKEAPVSIEIRGRLHLLFQKPSRDCVHWIALSPLRAPRRIGIVLAFFHARDGAPACILLMALGWHGRIRLDLRAHIIRIVRVEAQESKVRLPGTP